MKGIAVVLILVLFSGCAAITWDPSKRFVNRTELDDASFQSMAEAKWGQAQNNLAQPFCLNAAYMVLFNEPCDQRGPEPRASEINPDGVIIETAADAADRPGTILCRVGHCDAMLEDGNKIVVPASKPDNMGPYEMENVILERLGYDMRKR
jgi:hypothetical protein